MFAKGLTTKSILDNPWFNLHINHCYADSAPIWISGDIQIENKLGNRTPPGVSGEINETKNVGPFTSYFTIGRICFNESSGIL